MTVGVLHICVTGLNSWLRSRRFLGQPFRTHASGTRALRPRRRWGSAHTGAGRAGLIRKLTGLLPAPAYVWWFVPVAVVPIAPAVVPVVLAFRLITFWLPALLGLGLARPLHRRGVL